MPQQATDEYSVRPVINGYGTTLMGALLGGLSLGVPAMLFGLNVSSELEGLFYAFLVFVIGFAFGEAAGAGLLLWFRHYGAAGTTSKLIGALLGSGIVLEIILFQLGPVGLALTILGVPLLIIGGPLFARLWIVTDKRRR